MSFSSDIKQELNNNHSLIDKKNVEYELIGYLISVNTNILQDKKIKFSTENDYNIDRFSKLLSNLNIDYDIDIVGKVFNITINSKETKKINYIDIEKNKLYIKDTDDIYSENSEKENFENKKSIIRGAFLGAGSINNPENSYHLEIVLSNEENMIFFKKILESLNINTKELIAKTRCSVYFKESEEISNLLALIGANKAVMKFEDIRIQKEMRGKVNRIVNCETANLNKTINASIEQIGAIKKLQDTGKFNKLDENLKEIAKLRLENPNISLIELGKMLKKPVGKSGVNYRLKKIMEIADEE